MFRFIFGDEKFTGILQDYDDGDNNDNDNNNDDCNKIIFPCVQLALVRQTGYLQFSLSLKSV